jgi:hypothetical protein
MSKMSVSVISAMLLTMERKAGHLLEGHLVGLVATDELMSVQRPKSAEPRESERQLLGQREPTSDNAQVRLLQQLCDASALVAAAC